MGDPVGHSLSPLLHHAAFDAMELDWVSVGFAVPAGRAAEALEGVRALRIAGVSVTTPHKADVARCVDERTSVAERLGAVNCVIRRGDVLVGDSTDGAGFVAALRRGNGFDPVGRSCVVVGAGGAARAVVLALAEGGAAEVTVLNRTAARAESAAALAGPAGRVGSGREVSDADLVVQATSLGLAGEGSMPIDPTLLRRGQLVVDLVYHPPETPFLRAARSLGCVTVNGLGMLVHQAALAVGLWTGRSAPLEAMWHAAEAEASQTH